MPAPIIIISFLLFPLKTAIVLTAELAELLEANTISLSTAQLNLNVFFEQLEKWRLSLLRALFLSDC